jgi:amidase
MPVSQFPFGSATSLVRALRQRKVSSLELLNAYLKRIDQVNPAINAVVVQDRRAARAQARKADEEAARGIWRGPLHGLPMTVKEAFDLKGHARFRVRLLRQLFWLVLGRRGGLERRQR